jgi:KTSC domain
MGWVRLESSVLAAAQYLEDEQLLDLEFCSGAIYRYFEFPPHQYHELLTADSHGGYFNQYIVGRFPEQRIRSPRDR